MKSNFSNPPQKKLKSNFKNPLLFLFLCLFTSTFTAQEAERSGSLFIIGGGSRPASMVERIIRESGLDEGGYAVILPMASSEPDTSYYYAKRQFTELGITNIFKQVYDSASTSNVQKLDSLKNARLVYIPGGDQDRFMKAIAGTPAAEALKANYRNGGMIAGTSAGAAVMSEDMITGNELKHPEYHSTFRNLETQNLELKHGLGMLQDVIIDQHFVKRSRYNRLLTAILENPEVKGIGIDESTAILVRNGTAEVVGESQVIVFTNPEASKRASAGKLAGEGLKLDIYLHGDKFELEEK
ncbi:cyanophycinase [Salinimicrobium oceani]|uniref:Cyanophycinase n=1 Tax=Salinimicrobium oceani TaxID=2722702 RepID=A0ABX1CXV9_9FLAO|nr:cyanophycinase [Salinimicrobium oceani]NJW53110.1 cyanophycinase [Salinimicrobium oceani]